MNQTSQALIDAHEPWITPDLATYLQAIGGMFDEVELYAFDTADGGGWSILLDPDRCPAAALPHLAMYLGETLPVGIAESDAREWIKDAPNQRRGTIESIIYAAQRHLTGERTVQLLERPGGNVDQLIVTTYTDETPTPDLTLADLLSVVPADIDLIYSAADGQTWASVNALYASWSAVASANATWDDVAGAQPGYTVFSRPRVTT